MPGTRDKKSRNKTFRNVLSSRRQRQLNNYNTSGGYNKLLIQHSSLPLLNRTIVFFKLSIHPPRGQESRLCLQ